MNIFHADSRPLVHDVLIDLKTAKVAGKGFSDDKSASRRDDFSAVEDCPARC